MRLYLQYLGVSLYELIDTFRLARSQWKVRQSLLTLNKLGRFSELKNQLQGRAAVAEYLGLSSDEYVIITRESIWPSECSEFSSTSTILTLDQYRQRIGVRQAHKYWGYSIEADSISHNSSKVGLAWIKDQFLRRSGLNHPETVDLVRTYYVNPMYPCGRDRVFLDSIRFSYRILQLNTLNAAETVERNTLNAAFLFLVQPWVQAIELSEAPPTGNDLVKNVGGPLTVMKQEVSS